MKLSVLFILLILFSCNISNKEVEITLQNESGVKLDSIIIDSYDFKIKYYDVEDGVQVARSSPWKYQGNYEGNFRVAVYKDTLRTIGGFGYFANGEEANEKYLIRILQDFKVME